MLLEAVYSYRTPNGKYDILNLFEVRCKGCMTINLLKQASNIEKGKNIGTVGIFADCSMTYGVRTMLCQIKQPAGFNN